MNVTVTRALTLAITLLVPGYTLAQDFTGKVVGIVDGDSIKVMHEGKAEQIRLSGIDCPEQGQAFGNKAKQATSSLSFGKEVKVQPKTTDRYGRTVAEVGLSDGMNLNQELVKQGWCGSNAPNNQVLKNLERQARKQKLGLWVDPNPVPPWEFRKARAAKRNSLQPLLHEQSLIDLGPLPMQASDTLPVMSERKEPPTSASEQTFPILGNRKSHLYHRADCPNYSAIRPKNQVPFTSETKAQAAGYQLAGNCP